MNDSENDNRPDVRDGSHQHTADAHAHEAAPSEHAVPPEHVAPAERAVSAEHVAPAERAVSAEHAAPFADGVSAAAELPPAEPAAAEEPAPAPVPAIAEERAPAERAAAAEEPAPPEPVIAAETPPAVEEPPVAAEAAEPAAAADERAPSEAPAASEEPVPSEAAAVAEEPAPAEAAAVAEERVPAEAAAVAEERVVAEESALPEHPAAAEQSPAVEPAAADPGAAAAAVTGSEAAPRPPKPPKPELTEEQKAANAAAAEARRVRAQQAWERVVSAHAGGEVLSGVVTVAVKGGLLVDVGGIRGFLPASQARVPLGTAIETLVKTKVPLKVIDVDTARRRIVVSHRRAVDEERRAKRTELLQSLVVGQVREGTVVRLADFGAFVDLGGVDGLIPMRELAFERIDKAADVVTIGEKLMVEVLRIDEAGKKISLSRKNALPDPWRDHASVLRRDTKVEGKVVGKDPRLQVEIAPGVIGTVRESDANPADYEIGESIEVSVRSVDRATRRISLTTMHGVIPQAAAAPQQTASGFAPLGIELGRRR